MGHEILCACESCRKVKGLIIKIPKKNPSVYFSKPIENLEEYTKMIEIEVDTYELRRRFKDGIIEYKYFKREECPHCNGYIINTKLFDRCAKCGKDFRS